jgi:hypothetical protein
LFVFFVFLFECFLFCFLILFSIRSIPISHLAGDDGSESEGGGRGDFGTGTMMLNPLIPRARESDPSTGPKKRGVVGGESRVRVDRENPMNSSNATTVNPLNKSEDSSDRDVKVSNSNSGGIARGGAGGSGARPSGTGRGGVTGSAGREEGAHSPDHGRSMEEWKSDEEADRHVAPMLGKDSSPGTIAFTFFFFAVITFCLFFFEFLFRSYS